ncbi:MAG: SH3 domain-containing protein [Anaerolineae bacterium]|nr:SH3 domain-containing protein [Anaerolineae bacterium]
MANEKLAAVRSLINQKRYSEARAILETIEDDPMAQKLLAQINRKSPRSRPRRSGGGLLGYLAAILISAVITTLLIAVLVIVTAPSRGETIQFAVADNPSPTPASTPTTTPTSLPTVTIGVVASGQNVNLRGGPGTNFELIDSVPPGTEALVLETSEDGQWYNVRLSDGTEGWMFANLLELADATVTPNTGGAVASVPSATPEPTCTPEEAQAWWDAYPLYLQANYVILAASGSEQPNFDLLFDTIDNHWTEFRESDYPSCVEAVYQDVLDGMDTIWSALQAYENGNTSTAENRAETARSESFAPALERLSQLGVETPTTDCGAEFWYAIVKPGYESTQSFIDELDLAAAGSDTIRTGVFRLQEIRRDVADFYAPLCTTNARDSLLALIDSTVEAYRAVYDGNSSNAQAALANVTIQHNAFREELTRLGIQT